MAVAPRTPGPVSHGDFGEAVSAVIGSMIVGVLLIMVILLAVLAAFYAARGFVMSVRKTMQRHNQHRPA